jgi:glutamate synthase domain-containing protein 2/glutamate synthase domain-containing protein 1/glutamate synthase domain-containing protein 3
MEHRGGVGPDQIGDGAGIMTSIPFEFFNREPETFAVAFLYCPMDRSKREKSLEVFEQTFWQYGLKVSEYREVPINTKVISQKALNIMPYLLQAIVEKPTHCRTLYSFERLLYQARQTTRSKQKENGIVNEFFFSSLSPRSIVYKALCRSFDLKEFYLDLTNPKFKTSFALFHRRFSTNTISTWDKTQPFRLIAHNGEINTIEGNKAWAITREKELGLRADELITHVGTSDSGNLNGIAEGLRYRSSIPKLAETLAILIPPANSEKNKNESQYYKFWSRGMEPWDGPAMIAFSDGKHIGARLDRNGFRPSRWQRTADHFYLASEVGVFNPPEKNILAKGALSSGGSVMVNILSGAFHFLDAKDFPENQNVLFDPRVTKLNQFDPPKIENDILWKQKIFNLSKDEIEKIIIPMCANSSEPIGSMGDTAALAIMSHTKRSLFDFFYQNFAQVTNPPIDYIREKIVTDMTVFLGRKPNIFEAKDFVPLKPVIELDGPVLSLGQMEHLSKYKDLDLSAYRIDITFDRKLDFDGFNKKLDDIRDEAISALKNGHTLVILSDRNISKDRIAIPSLLAMAYLNLGLNETGRRLRTSLILEVGDVRNAHHLACLLSFGASAVCPYLAIETVLTSHDSSLLDYFSSEREMRFIKAMKDGVLKIMAKRGISVLRSYQGSKLFTTLGLGQDVLDKFFKHEKSLIGGMNLVDLFQFIKKQSVVFEGELENHFIFKEQASEKSGELHYLTSKRSRLIHKLLELENLEEAFMAFKEITQDLEKSPILIRHLLDFKKSTNPKNKNEIDLSLILKSFGSGAMSFGAISAESQRDLILAMRKLNARSNSGEGGENPFYYTDKISASIKQIGSGRFGVTAEYLVNGCEVQIKIAQGAKPGEGGQLMGVKVSEDIARARFSTPGIDLISPAPQHDIYSIEDLKQFIYEIKELSPSLLVSVKLVSSENIGGIAVGVVKAGADIIQISGGDGGTGAASLLSMKHAGLPLEIGLKAVHQELLKNDLRENVILRADGGFISGKDIIIASMLGADEFDFGKILLVSEGCIMARICEKNTCPTGIATQSPKFKNFYKGNPEKVVRLLECIALEVQEALSSMGLTKLKDLRGRDDFIKINEKHLSFIKDKNIDLKIFTESSSEKKNPIKKDYKVDSPSILNDQILLDIKDSKNLEYPISNLDRAIPARLSGLYAKSQKSNEETQTKLIFKGSAGQGFGVFNVKEINIRLIGEASDSVAKGMSGGKIVITSNVENNDFIKEENSIIGNCALYGATGGELFVHGLAGDRFAVRNSGAKSIVEGVGFHACEYMSGGVVWILGPSKGNLGAGMTGGVIYTFQKNAEHINRDYIKEAPLTLENRNSLRILGEEYFKETGSLIMKKILESEDFNQIIKLVPKK